MPKDTVVMAFSLSPQAAAYVNGAGRGRKSALVDRCIRYSKDNQVEELLQMNEIHIKTIARLREELDKTQVGKAKIDDSRPNSPLVRALLHFGLWKRPSK